MGLQKARHLVVIAHGVKEDFSQGAKDIPRG